MALRPVVLCALVAHAVWFVGQVNARPNVLFIVVDDLNDWVGCLDGHPQAETPNIDKLAARGMLFTNAHCAAPACNPSRAAVFSGQMPQTNGVWSNASPRLLQLQPNCIHLPLTFSRAGYTTLGTGKLLHGGDKLQNAFDDCFPVEQRWSPFSKSAVAYSAEELPSKGSSHPRHAIASRQGDPIVLPLNGMPSDRKPTTKAGESFDWGPIDLPDASWGDTQITDWAIENLTSDLHRPFFLAVGYYRPHIPLWAPKKYFERFETSPASLPPIHPRDLDDLGHTARNWARRPVTAGSHATVVKHQQWRAAVEAYLACTSYVDHQIGRLVDALDQSHVADETLIVLWSDHGWHLGEKEHWGKWTGWERSTRVPLIVVPAKKDSIRFAAAGARCRQPVSLIDLYPTLTELCGIASPKHLQGRSLVPLLRFPERDTHRGVVTMFDQGNASLRTERWRYIRYADGSEELYDHHIDPNEWNNIAESAAGRIGLIACRKQLNTLLEQTSANRKP